MIKRIFGLGIAMSLVLSVGCSHKHGLMDIDRFSDIPAGAIPEPAGNKTAKIQSDQISNALVDQYFLYLADFVGDSTSLSPNATERLNRMHQAGALASRSFFLQPSGKAQLDKQRVDSVQDYFDSYGIEDVTIEVANPAALGLQGNVAEASVLGRGRTSGGNTGMTGGRVLGPFNAFSRD